ncbi:response regulator transcription factor [Pedobacter sp. N23S346]|uniref:response regulator transcription factor n=1 Tax=Pedobacter sp. N23S346 TaxID=3402750 RepID=UPI003AD2581D
MRQLKHLLLIDDDESIREMIPFIFDKTNYLVKTIADIINIETLVDDFKPDLIMLDIVLGVEDGREICRNLKRLPALANVPIILLSAAIIKEEDLDCGHELLITKPFDISYLESTVEKLILKRQGVLLNLPA